MLLKKIASRLAGIFSTRRGKVLCSICAAATLLCLLTSFVVLQLNHVTVTEDGKEIASFTTIKSEQNELLEVAGVTLASEDKLDVKVNGQNIALEIHRAFPVTVKVDGHIITVMTIKGTTVDGVLKAAGISYSEQDKLSAGANAVVSADMEISLIRRITKTEIKTQEIPFEKKTEKTDTLYQGQSKVKQTGVAGEKTLTYSVVYENGKEVSRTLTDTSITKEARDEITLVGTKKKEVTVKTPSGKVDLTGARRITVTATAYWAGDDGGSVTCLGKVPSYGTVAVDPRVIPLGTKMYICSPDGSYVYGYCVAGDTGGAIKGNRVDLFMNSGSACNAFGRRTMYVYILD
ncbi:MAG: G5 domain-containing protein [Clostridia bacterium]|nr:G5 domain-containing protein [Clostridia bacterium]